MDYGIMVFTDGSYGYDGGGRNKFENKSIWKIEEWKKKKKPFNIG